MLTRSTRGLVGPPPGITHGRQVSAANTGIAGVGLTVGDLTPTVGPLITTNGTVLEGLRFTSNVKIQANNCTIRKCAWTFNGAADLRALIIEGTGNTIEDCIIKPPNGFAFYEGIYMQDGVAFNTTLRRLHIENCGHLLTDECSLSGGGLAGGYALICEDSYLVRPQPDQVGQHLDCVQVYGGGTGAKKLYSRCWVEGIQAGDYCWNIVPFGSNSVDGVDIFDCYMDQGSSHIVAADNQTSGFVRHVRLMRNDMGGWTFNGDYNAFQIEGGLVTVGSQAAQDTTPGSLLIPTTGPDANYWRLQAGNPGGLSPDRTGSVVVP